MLCWLANPWTRLSWSGSSLATTWSPRKGKWPFGSALDLGAQPPPEGAAHLAAEIAALGDQPPFVGMEWKPLLRWWREGPGPGLVVAHPQTGRGHCPDCLEPKLRGGCDRAHPEPPWHWLQPCAFGPDQAGGLLCRRCRVIAPRGSRVLWNPGCLGEPSGPGRLDGWRGGWAVAQWLDAHPPAPQLPAGRRRVGWYNPSVRRVRIPLPVGGRPAAGPYRGNPRRVCSL